MLHFINDIMLFLLLEGVFMIVAPMVVVRMGKRRRPMKIKCHKKGSGIKTFNDLAYTRMIRLNAK
jgi:hypothetical protein